MSGWAWFAIIWFGTLMLLFVMGCVKDVVRSRWGLSERVTQQIEDAINRALHRWMSVEGEGGDEQPARDDTLPLKFKDLDDLSGQL